MAIRTDADLVKSVLMSDYGPASDGFNPSLTMFIRIANRITDKVAECATAKGDTQDDDTLLDMETWLAAHYYAMSDQTVANRQGESYHGQTGMGLEATKYGQSALNLDFTKCLYKVTTKGNSASIAWLGKSDTDISNWEDRN